MNKEMTLKIMELSGRCLDICHDRDEMTHGDLGGAFTAVIMDAVRYGRDLQNELFHK